MNEEDPTCNFTCNIGYELTAGNAKRTCQIDGSWSGTDAVCTVGELIIGASSLIVKIALKVRVR